jgi:hypothetical protein
MDALFGVYLDGKNHFGAVLAATDGLPTASFRNDLMVHPARQHDSATLRPVAQKHAAVAGAPGDEFEDASVEARHPAGIGLVSLTDETARHHFRREVI